MEQIKAIRGIPDILPEEIDYWHYFEAIWKTLIERYGYNEIRLPLLESTSLFKRSIGEATDIVEKEMFTFQDRDNASISLRPEGTAPCVRAAIEHGLLHNQTQRLWYLGPMFRYERPQKGRYRQFYQIGVEAFGFSGIEIELEQLFLMWRLWMELGLENDIQLQINNIGTFEARQHYKQQLVDFLKPHEDKLDNDCKRRLTTNPLRILDSKNPEIQALLNNSPKLQDFLDTESKENMQQMFLALQAMGIPYSVNPHLVRGLDYYNHTVYEWVTDKLGAQGAVCAGGRYDGLVQQLGGAKTDAVGFAIGMDRVVLLLKQRLLPPMLSDIFLIGQGERAKMETLLLAEQIRTHLPTLKVLVHCGLGNFKSAFKKADKSGAKLAIILGETEIQEKTIGIKYLREDKSQVTIQRLELILFLQQYFQK